MSILKEKFYELLGNRAVDEEKFIVLFDKNSIDIQHVEEDGSYGYSGHIFYSAYKAIEFLESSNAIIDDSNLTKSITSDIHEYVVEIATDFGELKVNFTTENMLKNSEEVFKTAMNILTNSKDIKLTGLSNKVIYYDILYGATLEEL